MLIILGIIYFLSACACLYFDSIQMEHPTILFSDDMDLEEFLNQLNQYELRITRTALIPKK